MVIGKRLRRFVYGLLMEENSRHPLRRISDFFLLGFILANAAAIVLASVRSFGQRYGAFFTGFEYFSVAVFTVEYLLRLWSCAEDPRYRDPLRGRLRYMLSPMAIVDLLAVLPFYIAAGGADLRMLRILRVFRLLRLVKIARYSKALQVFGRVLVHTWGQLVFSLVLLAVLLLLASSLIYMAEQDAQPEAFSSIPAAMWWAIATLTTVGYGDIYPVTPLGKFLGSVIAVFGIGMFALPAGVLGAAFLEEIQAMNKTTVCPHCGRRADEARVEGGGESPSSG